MVRVWLALSLPLAFVAASKPKGPQLLMSQAEGKRCLEAQSTTSGAKLWTVPCTDSDLQRWEFDSAGQLILSSHTSKCIDINHEAVEGSGGVGSGLELWKCTGLPQQQWEWDHTAHSIKQSTSVGSLLCAILGPNPADLGLGTTVLLNACLGQLYGKRQYWDLVEASPTPAPPAPAPLRTGMVKNTATSACLSLPSSSPSNGQLLKTSKCSGAAQQQWAFWNGHLAYDGSTAWTHCMDVPGADTTDGNQLEVWECGAWPQQLWSLNDQAVSLQSENKCMSVRAATGADVPVEIDTCASSDTKQQWQILTSKAGDEEVI